MNGTKLSRTILPLLLMIAMLFPVSALAASPAGEFSGAAAVELRLNVPELSPDSAADGDFVRYSELDALGRPGAVNACLSRASLQSGLRDDSAPLPVGWGTTHYREEANEPQGEAQGETQSKTQFLYRLCSVLSPALGGDASDLRNVFTGTRTLRDTGMQPYVDKVADYLSRTANHVLYRVTPAYHGDDLVPFGVQMEALSVEDSGRTISFNVFLYNVEPGFSIDYRTGESVQDGAIVVEQTGQALLVSHYFPAPSPMVAPQYGSFEALYDAFAKATGVAAASTAQLQRIMQLWVPKTGDKYHLVNPCGNMDSDGASQRTVDLTTISESQLCETCCQKIIQGLASLKASVAAANARAQAANAASQGTQSASQAANSSSQNTSSTPAPSQGAGALPLITPAPSDKPSLLSLGSSLFSSATSTDTTMVWVTSSEKVYHSTETCSQLEVLYAYMKTLDWATMHGYERCPYCW